MKAEIFLPEDYRPAESEPFMNDLQLEYFRRKLIVWKQELLGQSAETIDNLQESARSVPDLADRASEETDRALELRTRDRQRKLDAVRAAEKAQQDALNALSMATRARFSAEDNHKAAQDTLARADEALRAARREAGL